MNNRLPKKYIRDFDMNSKKITFIKPRRESIHTRNCLCTVVVRNS